MARVACNGAAIGGVAARRLRDGASLRRPECGLGRPLPGAMLDCVRVIALVVFLLLTINCATYAQPLQVPIDVGLRRLAADASSGLVEDRGDVIKKESDDGTVYALAFSISGLSNCKVTDIMTTCQAYHGNDATQAASTFWQLVSALHKAFAEKEHIPVSATRIQGVSVTQASYKPNPNGMSSWIDIEMEQRAEGCDVTLHVYTILSS